MRALARDESLLARPVDRPAEGFGERCVDESELPSRSRPRASRPVTPEALGNTQAERTNSTASWTSCSPKAVSPTGPGSNEESVDGGSWREDLRRPGQAAAISRNEGVVHPATPERFCLCPVEALQQAQLDEDTARGIREDLFNAWLQQ